MANGNGRKSINWRSRIVGYGTKPADQFQANPENWRKHPPQQRRAVATSLDTLGWIDTVIENVTTGNLVDGHERVWQALEDNADVPYLQVELSEAEERLALATFDPIGAMAETDADMLSELLAALGDVPEFDAEDVSALLAEIGRSVTEPGEDDWAAAFGGLPDGDRAPFQQMTFTLHDEQAEIVAQAVAQAKRDCDFSGQPNENSNGNALYMVCRAYLNGFS